MQLSYKTHLMELRVINTLLYNFMWCSFAFQTHAQLIQTRLSFSLFMMGLRYKLIHPNEMIKIFASVNMTAVFEARLSNSVTCCVVRGVHPNHQDAGSCA